MKKKILLVISAVLITVIFMVPSVSAEDVSVMAVLPTYDDVILYTLFPASHYNEPIYYNIVGMVTSGAASNPNAIPFMRTYYPDYENVNGTYWYELYDGQSKILTTITNGETYSMSIVANNPVTGDVQLYELVGVTDVSIDFFLYVGRDGYIYLQKYDYSSGLYVSAAKRLDIPLYGDIYLYNDTPDNSQSYNNGYIAGKADGINEGYNKGYTDGMNEQNTIWQSAIDSIRQEEYNRGKAEGIQEGIQQSASSSVDKEYWYNAGFTAGQDTNGIVKEGIEGFWNAMQGFIDPFLNIGIGSLRVYSILAILLIGGLAFIFIKLKRG